MMSRLGLTQTCSEVVECIMSRDDLMLCHHEGACSVLCWTRVWAHWEGLGCLSLGLKIEAMKPYILSPLHRLLNYLQSHSSANHHRKKCKGQIELNAQLGAHHNVEPCNSKG